MLINKLSINQCYRYLRTHTWVRKCSERSDDVASRRLSCKLYRGDIAPSTLLVWSDGRVQEATKEWLFDKKVPLVPSPLAPGPSSYSPIWYPAEVNGINRHIHTNTDKQIHINRTHESDATFCWLEVFPLFFSPGGFWEFHRNWDKDCKVDK